MQIEKSRQKLNVVLPGDFNLNTVRIISDEIGDRKEIGIDLANARFVNSKAIIFLHKLMYKELPVKVKLKNPPRIFFELLKIMGLHTVWNLEEIIEP